MKSKRLIKYISKTILALLGVFVLYAILTLAILPTLNIGSECGNWTSTVPAGGKNCSCYGIKYNPEPDIDGSAHYKCVGYCPLDSCKDNATAEDWERLRQETELMENENIENETR